MASQTEETKASTNPWYLGSCHCEAITYRVQLDLKNPNPTSNAILTKCNCTICHKTGMVLAAPNPETSLTVLTPTDKQTGITDYRFNKGGVGHNFCAKCGVRCFFTGSFDMGGGNVFHFTRVNALTLDGREDGEPLEDLREIKLKYYGFRHDLPTAGAEPFEGGIW